jgi:phosphatidylethanolamine/phosphatidyl-N-methylethanolamine N-methyltransferase
MTTTSEKFYDRLTFLYPVVDLFLKPQKRRFVNTINEFPHGRLLEIGVGNGSHLKYYRNHCITAIDTSRRMLARAAKSRTDRVFLLHMNGEAIRFPDETFDYVILSHVITVVEDPERLLEEASRVLRPNGKLFILNHFTSDNWLGYVDVAFEKLSRLLHFKSVFYINTLRSIRAFKLLTESGAGPFSYFKILIYEKNV